MFLLDYVIEWCIVLSSCRCKRRTMPGANRTKTWLDERASPHPTDVPHTDEF